MARRKKQGTADDFMDVVALLPWWGGVVLALVSYLILHRLAAVPPGPLQPGQMADLVTRSMIAALASAGQIIVPFLCLFGALGSFLRRRKCESLVAGVVQSRSADALNGMSWREFEMLVGEAFRLQGYKVTEQGGAQADGGIDLVLRKGSETHLVQCKQWKAYKVGVDVVRQLYGVMAAQGAAGGFVITSGTFTADAKAFAEGRNVKLVDGSKLFGMIQQAKGAAPSPAPSEVRPTPPHTPSPAASEPVCPTCQASMVRRTAKKAGSEFWGCSRYPACRGTR